ncbi:unnamed protein product, partial [Mesorhabditis spiculigera]
TDRREFRRGRGCCGENAKSGINRAVSRRNFVADDVLVHAIPAGVVKNSLRESIDRLVPDFIEIWRLDPEVVGAEALNSAAQFLVSRLGCAYNDIFSDNCRNSEGQEAYYCSQLKYVE